MYNHALYCELLAPTLCPQRPNYILVQKEQLSTLQNFTQHTQEGGMARKVSVESLSTSGSEHFGRPVTIHTQCPLSLSTLKRDRKVAGHIENRRLFICHQEQQEHLQVLKQESTRGLWTHLSASTLTTQNL